jgi:hypothetical protein
LIVPELVDLRIVGGPAGAGAGVSTVRAGAGAAGVRSTDRGATGADGAAIGAGLAEVTVREGVPLTAAGGIPEAVGAAEAVLAVPETVGPAEAFGAAEAVLAVPATAGPAVGAGGACVRTISR